MNQKSCRRKLSLFEGETLLHSIDNWHLLRGDGDLIVHYIVHGNGRSIGGMSDRNKCECRKSPPHKLDMMCRLLNL